MVQHSLLCSYYSQPKEVSLAIHELIHSGLIGQPCLHMSPRSGDRLPLVPASPSAANKCRPISAHALSVSAERQALHGTSFEATGSFATRKKQSPPCGRYFPGTFQQVNAVRKRTLSHGSKQGQTPSQNGPSQNLGTHTAAGHCNPHDLPRDSSSQRPLPVKILQAL